MQITGSLLNIVILDQLLKKLSRQDNAKTRAIFETLGILIELSKLQ